MALNSGFDRIDPAADSFSDWLNKTNELIDLMRGDTPSGGIIHANNSIANTDGDARLHGAFIANSLHVVNCIYGGDIYANGVFNETDLTICTNAVFEDNLTINGHLDYILASNNYTDILPETDCAYSIGNLQKQWEGYFCDLNVSGNTSLNNLSVTGDATMTSLSINELEINNITVLGTANIQLLEVATLTANGVVITGNEGSVTTSSKQVLETFSKFDTKGFKYIIHGQNTDASSVYTLEMMCGHNGTNLFYTRYGELVNNFNVVLEPKITGAAIELEVTCPDASISNVHTFNIVRIETR